MPSGEVDSVMAFSENVGEAQEVSLMVAIIEAIAERKGVDALEFTPPLFEAIDTEIVELLSGKSANDGFEGVCIQFSYQGFEVTLDGDDVRITPE